MGEMIGNMWSTLLFMVMFAAIASLTYIMVDSAEVNGTIVEIRDNIKIDNAEKYLKSLDSKYRVCSDPMKAVTTQNCTGIVSVDEANRIVNYQVSYDGLMLDLDASDTTDRQVVLPY